MPPRGGRTRGRGPEAFPEAAALTVVHEALAAVRGGPAAAALVEASPPQRGRLDVVARLQPAAAGQRDDVEGDGAEQEQGQNPPAALAGQAAAQHVDGGGAEQRIARGPNAGGEWPASAGRATKGRRRARGRGAWPHLDSGDSERAAPTCPAQPGQGGRGERRGRAQVTPGEDGLPRPGAETWRLRAEGPRIGGSGGSHARLGSSPQPHFSLTGSSVRQRVHVLICATAAKY